MAHIDWNRRLVASPACNPTWPLPDALAAWQALGLTQMEVFTTWVASRHAVGQDAKAYVEQAHAHGLQPTSFHMPAIQPEDERSWVQLQQAATDAKILGVDIVLFKANTKDDYVAAAPRALNLFAEHGLTGVLQNHKNAALSTLEDTLEVLDRIDDPRMKALLEVGHLHAAGCPWQRAYPALKDRTVLVHIKDIADGASVPYGEGEVDLPGLFRQLAADAYPGNVVVEIEIRETPETDRHLRQALDYLRAWCF